MEKIQKSLRMGGLFIDKDLKKIVDFIEHMDFTSVSHPSSLHKQIYVKDNMVIHIEEKTIGNTL